MRHYRTPGIRERASRHINSSEIFKSDMVPSSLISSLNADLWTGPNGDIHKTHTSTMRWNWAANHLRNFLRVEVDTGAERLTIKIGLKSAGMGFYALYIDILPEVLPESSGELGFQEDQLPASASTINGNEDSLLDGQSQRGRGGERLKDRSENYEGVAM